MIQLKDKFYEEEELQKLLFDKKITVLDYCMHHSEEKRKHFLDYCRKNKLPQNDDSASAFLAKELKDIENTHIEGLD